MSVSARMVIAILFSASMLASQRLPADAGCTPQNDWPRVSGNLLTKTARVATATPRQIEIPLGGRTSIVMRRVGPPQLPDGAVDLRILGDVDAPAILSLIAPGEHYADYTYNGSDADLDVSRGGLNLRPLDGTGAVNIWSMAGNTRLRVGSRNFRQALDLWHSSENAYMRSTSGRIIIESPVETKSAPVLGGDTFISGNLRVIPVRPASSSSGCTSGQIVWDADHIYVCTATNQWKRAALSAY